MGTTNGFFLLLLFCLFVFYIISIRWGGSRNVFYRSIVGPSQVPVGGGRLFPTLLTRINCSYISKHLFIENCEENIGDYLPDQVISCKGI